VDSLKRGAATTIGQKMMDFTASIGGPRRRPYAEIERTLRAWYWNRSNAIVVYGPIMMPNGWPKRRPPADKEQIGSGPFKFVQAEFQRA